MKTQDFKSHFTSARQELKRTTKKIMLTNMVAQNISDMIPEGWEVNSSGYGLKIKPPEGTTIDQFEKLMRKISRALNLEPQKEVRPEYICFDFWVYPCAYDRFDWKESVNIEFSIGNTEKCEFIYKRKMQKIAEPTGYCKLLKEKQFLCAQ